MNRNKKKDKKNPKININNLNKNKIEIKEKGKKNKSRKKDKKDNPNFKMAKTSNLNINWYPGHMFKTKEQLKEITKKIDMVIEVLDARIPFSSSNADLKEITKNREKIIILNKSDLADDEISNNWVYFLQKKEQCNVIKINALDQKDINKLKIMIKSANILKEKIKKAEEKGIKNPNIKVMIVGIPNCGKSTIINKIVGKNSQDVKNIPGVTKNNKWIRTKDNINILDTPGVLLPRLEENVGINLAAIGSIKLDLFDKIEICSYLLKNIIKMDYLEGLSNRYNIDMNFLKEIKDLEFKISKQKEFTSDNDLNKLEDLYFKYNIKIYELMKRIGKNRGFIKKGNEIDDEKVATTVLNEFQKGMLGKISLERITDE